MKYIKKIGYLFFTLALVTNFQSCEQESVADESDIALDQIGLRSKWVVEIIRDGSFFDNNTISTYNTSANATDAMWVDDLEHGWGLKAKVNLNPEALTFSGNDLDELYYGVTVTITEGQVIRGGATTPSGETVDSISFKAVFSDIPDEVWEYAGYRSTAKVDDLP